MPLSSTPAVADRQGTVTSASGLSATFTESGCLAGFEAFGLSLVQYPASPVEAGPANVHLRRHGADGAEHTPLLGPASGSSVGWSDSGPRVTGTWGGLGYTLTFSLGADDTTWFWDLSVTNTTGATVRIDAVLTHDPALAPLDAVRTNEYYVSQYLDITPVPTDEHGTALAVRQNMPGRRAPWLLVGSLGTGTGWSTDALQLVSRRGDGVRWTGLEATDLPGSRMQHEHSLIALQDEPVDLAPGATHRTGFYGIVVADHPEATSEADARWSRRALASQPSDSMSVDSAPADWMPAGSLSGESVAVPTLFSQSPVAACRPLTVAELDAVGLGEARLPETSEGGTLLSWFTDRGQVVTGLKDLVVLRPHGQVLRTGDSLSPDAGSLTSTMWMAGTFHSQVTRGHVGRRPVLTSRRTYLGLQRAHGLRLFVESADSPSGWILLETPSAWIGAEDHCTWWYAVEPGLVLEVTAAAPASEHELGLDVRFVSGAPRPLLATLQLGDEVSVTDPRPDGVALISDGETSSPVWHLSWPTASVAVVGDDAPIFDDAVSRGRPWLTLTVPANPTWSLRITADTSRPSAATRLGQDFWDDVLSVGLHLDGDHPAARHVAHLDAALPSFTQNALIHYLAPRGLEQYSGGAWGTRDICQGPVGLLTAIDRQDVVRDVLLSIFRAQNERGDWPQAFEFMPPNSEGGQHEAHGDVPFWPLLATGEYLLATADRTLLTEQTTLVGDSGPSPAVTIEEHLRRAIGHIEEATVPGSPLPAYGHGDWNDSLQPADPHLAKRLVSTWTAVLQTHSLRSLAAGLRATGAASDLAEAAAQLADDTEAAIHEVMLTDDLLPGYVLFHEDGTHEPLVHPDDTRTGLSYGILPWVHAIAADLLSPEQARHHLMLLQRHLLGPDGARLFDRPAHYSGGPMSVFQRAEASTFWGREIGLMYMHAHLRYAEALARVGDAPALLRALALVTPVGLEDLVPQARPRQSTSYYSSSDGVFTDRYDAQDHYGDLMSGDVALEGGWRVYSSGPGLTLRLVVEAFLGFRARGARLEVDPVLAPGLDGLEARVPLCGKRARVTYRVGPEGVGVREVLVNSRRLTPSQLDNPYRRGGASVLVSEILAAFEACDTNRPEIRVETY